MRIIPLVQEFNERASWFYSENVMEINAGRLTLMIGYDVYIEIN
jgi:hypothetical protein